MIEAGQRFGNLTVQKVQGFSEDEDVNIIKLMCDCGDSTFSYQKHLLSGKRTSCMKCQNPVEDLTGNVYFNLTVLGKSPVSSRYGKAQWRCLCKCGKVIELTGHFLTSGQVKSCGCEIERTMKKSSRKIKKCGDVTQSYFNLMQARALRNNIEFTITIEYLAEMFAAQDGKCSLTGLPIKFMQGGHGWDGREQTASLDRIDSYVGYVPGNVTWVHKDVNRMKQMFDNDYFIGMCRAVVVQAAKAAVL